MYILLPPSEGKSARAGHGVLGANPGVNPDDTRAVLDHINRLRPAERARFYGLKDAGKCAAAHALNTACFEASALPAIDRYTGVVYDHIDYPTLRKKAAARNRVLIVSALFGLIPAGAPIPDYKLSMNPWLARYWKSINTARLADRAGGKAVLDLLSQSYRKAVEHPNLITVDFRVEGGKKAAGHFGKAIKGRFVRWILENNAQSTSDFVDFTEDGYRFDGSNFVRS